MFGEATENNHFLNQLILQLGSCLATPEEEIIKQGDASNDLFFISQGDCAVFYTDTSGQSHLHENLLTEGDHFGEIALIYRCKRTMTVKSRNYNTMASLSYENYRNLINEFPWFQKLLKAYLYRYNDMRKASILKMLLSIDFLREIRSNNVIHSLVYLLKERRFFHEEIILREYEPVTSIFFIEFGEVEVYTECDGHEFIIERLKAGTCINAYSFMALDQMYINIRSKNSTQLLELDSQTL